MLNRTLMSLVIVIIALLLISQSVAIVHQGQAGVVLRFGTVAQADLKPGLHFKLPFMEQIVALDDHWITLDSDLQNGGRVKFTTADGKALETSYMAVWHITDMAVFCRATACDESTGARRLNDDLMPLLRRMFADHPLGSVLTDKAGRLLIGIPTAVNAQLKALGAQMDSLQITALMLPPDALDTIYERMRSEQLEQAAKLGAQGVAAADRIRAEAEQQQAQFLAQAGSQAQKIRGAAEAQAADIYARAYRQDPEFFRFYRSLQAYRRIIKNGNSVVVLGADSALLKYINGMAAGGPAPH